MTLPRKAAFFMLAALLSAIVSAPAQSRPAHTQAANPSCEGLACLFSPPQTGTPGAIRKRGRTAKANYASAPSPVPSLFSAIDATSAQSKGVKAGRTPAKIVGGRPAGCPATKFCGCALSLKLFGVIKPELNLAANWLKYFQRTSHAPGMVGARRGHALMLLSQVSGSRWLVWDPNSGGHKIRIRERDISSFTIVDPNARRVSVAAR